MRNTLKISIIVKTFVIILTILICCMMIGAVINRKPNSKDYCYRFVDYNGDEYVESTDNWYCFVSYGDLLCASRGGVKRKIVQEFEKITCPKIVGDNNE